jgi:ribosomal protein L13E
MKTIRPTIEKPNGRTKSGKGFSPNELAKAGVTKLQALQMGFAVDFRRRTAHDSNIEQLKAHAAQAKPADTKKTEA